MDWTPTGQKITMVFGYAYNQNTNWVILYYVIFNFDTVIWTSSWFKEIIIDSNLCWRPSHIVDLSLNMQLPFHCFMNRLFRRYIPSFLIFSLFLIHAKHIVDTVSFSCNQLLEFPLLPHISHPPTSSIQLQCDCPSTIILTGRSSSAKVVHLPCCCLSGYLHHSTYSFLPR